MGKFVGSCLCGDVNFEIVGDFAQFYLCHCSYCRKDTGSAHAANLFSSNAHVTWTTGKDSLRQFTLPSTRHSRSFCSRCGSALPDVQMDGALVVVPAGSLDCDAPLRPQAHIFVARKAGWDHELEAVPKAEGLPV